MTEKQIFCAIIKNPPPDWGFWRKVTDRQKYLNFDKNTFPDNAYFCGVLDDISNFEEIEILGRIGSPSRDAEVYRIKFQGLDFAMKMMPRIDNDSELKNRNEIQTAIEASKYSIYFPITFAYGYCPDSSYYISANNEKSSFIPKAIEYSSINKILVSIDNKNTKKRFEYDYRNGMTISELKNKYNLDECENNTIQVDFLISELANGDLGNWMTKSREILDWKKVLTDVITGIYYMTTQLKIVHPDLHPGNVLIIREKENIKALIHDFGRCYFLDGETDEMNKATLLSFTSEFISCSHRDDLIIPREILIMVQDIHDSIKNEKITMNNIQSIYENLIFPILLWY